MRIFGAALALAAALFVAAADAHADGEHGRRLAAELVLIRGDAARLVEPGTADLHKQGLRARIGGALVGLGMLVRRARQEFPRPVPPAGWRGRLRDAFAAGDIPRLMTEIDGLVRLYPLDLTGILPARPTPGRLRLAKALHEDVCAACHDSPDMEVPLPAFDLFDQAARLPAAEFAARLLSGIRGDTLTNVQNPFTDEEIAALIAFYNAGER